ncbi:ester cyclase [Streptomyces sp. NPDC059582]|uniref:ester cyclase n=1 Tax=Streptomyces sp. NPDC059582 TaxID=3346875 RepID=UPI0036B5B3A3
MVEELHNGHRLERLDAFYGEGHQEHDPRVLPGPGGLRDFWRDLLHGFPDLRVTVDVLLADGDRVMAFMTWRGRQSGPFAGRPASGRELELRSGELFRLDGGRIAEHWAVVDYSVLRTFGAVHLQGAGPVRAGLDGRHGAAERENTALVLGAYEEVLTGHRLDRAEAYYERDYVHHNAQMPAVPNGVEAFKVYFAGNFAAFPDLTATVDHVVADGDRVMVFATWRGHFTGVSRGRAPTGRRLLMHTCDQFRLVEGKVAEHWEVVDYSGLQDAGIPVRPPVLG